MNKYKFGIIQHFKFGMKWYYKKLHQTKGVGRKFFQRGARKKRPKISKKYRKIALFSLFQEGGATEKRPKNSKKGRK